MPKPLTNLKEAERLRRELANHSGDKVAASPMEASVADDEALRERIEAQYRAAAQADPWKSVALDRAAPRTYPLVTPQPKIGDEASQPLQEATELPIPVEKEQNVEDDIAPTQAANPDKELKEDTGQTFAHRPADNISLAGTSAKPADEATEAALTLQPVAADLISEAASTSASKIASADPVAESNPFKTCRNTLAGALLSIVIGFGAGFWLGKTEPSQSPPATADAEPAGLRLDYTLRSANESTRQAVPGR